MELQNWLIPEVGSSCAPARLRQIHGGGGNVE
jgi:hypothetical protein